jgi:hypothetical protein
MKPIGRRYRLFFDIVAECYNDGQIILRQHKDFDVFDEHGKLTHATGCFTGPHTKLGAPKDVRAFVASHGRPAGMLWK